MLAFILSNYTCKFDDLPLHSNQIICICVCVQLLISFYVLQKVFHSVLFYELQPIRLILRKIF